MPGTMSRVHNPRGGHRKLYTIRGVVEAHETRETGFWIFKERTFCLRIQLNQAQVEAFNRLARSEMTALNHCHLQGVKTIVLVQVDEEKLKGFPVDSPVAVTIGYAGSIEQFFNGSDPLAVTSIQVLTAETVLENEIEVSETVSPPPEDSKAATSQQIHVVFGNDLDEATGASTGYGPIAGFEDKDEAAKFATGWRSWGSSGRVVSLPWYPNAEEAYIAERARVERGMQKRAPESRQHL